MSICLAILARQSLRSAFVARSPLDSPHSRLLSHLFFQISLSTFPGLSLTVVIDLCRRRRYSFSLLPHNYGCFAATCLLRSSFGFKPGHSGLHSEKFGFFLTKMSDFVYNSVSTEEYYYPRLKHFAHLALNSSSDVESEAETVIAPPRAGHHEHDACDISHHGVDIPTPVHSSVAPHTSSPRPPVLSDERHLCDASDTSSLYDGHYKHHAFSFPRGGKMTQAPCSDDASYDGTLGEYYDADDELSSADLMSEADRMKASIELPTKAFFQYKILTKPLLKMMFVSGETAEPSVETTTLIEDITREQVLEIVRSSTSYYLHSYLLRSNVSYSSVVARPWPAGVAPAQSPQMT